MNGFDDTDMPDAGDESDISSVFDVETPASDQLRTYTAIDPPELPDSIRIDGQDRTTQWYEDSWRYTARAYHEWDGSGFEVRQLKTDNSGDPKPADPNDAAYWPPKYALGPPTQDTTQEADWHYLIEKWGLPILEKAGFLNYYPPENDRDMDPIGRLAKARNPSKDFDGRIHPVLRKDMWRKLGDDDYELLEPALLLASAFLDDPATLTFLYAITDIDSMTEFNDSVHGKCKVAHVPAALTDAQQTAVYEKVLAMRNWTSWHFKSTARMVAIGALGVTTNLKDSEGKFVPASHNDTVQSVIGLTRTSLDIFRRYNDDCFNDTNEHQQHLMSWLGRYNVQPDRRPKRLDPASAVDRTTYHLANTIVHEFGHAYTKAYFRRPDDNAPMEPWISEHRSNEMGFAIIDHLFGGCVHYMPRWDNDETTAHTQELDAPFGMYFERRWDLWGKDDEFTKVKTATTVDAQGSRQTFYPVPQKWFYNMHTEETWKHQVPRFGMAGIRLPKLEDWAISGRQAS